MRARNGWLFPLMVLAAGSVMVFGCIGIAAITGYLPLAKVSAMPFAEPVIVQATERVPASLADPALGHAMALATDATHSPEDQVKNPSRKKSGPQ